MLGDQQLGLVGVSRGTAQREDRLEHRLEGVRVDGEHVGGAAEVGERVVDHRDVDGADGAQVLGHHQVGVEPGESARVEVVEVVTTRHRRDHEGVDLAGRESLRHRRGRHDAALARLRWVVALEGHADHVVAGADREQDLRGRREQRDDPHTLTLGR